MGCKTCEVYARDTTLLQQEVARLQELAAANLRLANDWQRGLKEERARKESVLELLRTAGEASQIAKLSAGAFPEGDSVADEAGAVALGALKQVRERLEEGAEG